MKKSKRQQKRLEKRPFEEWKDAFIFVIFFLELEVFAAFFRENYLYDLKKNKTKGVENMNEKIYKGFIVSGNKVCRWVKKIDEKIFEYDSNGHIVHEKDSEGFEKWYEYDEKGNEIHLKESDGFEVWHEYDENGNKIHTYDNWFGDEFWYEYDKNGKQIYEKHSNGFEKNFIYDEFGHDVTFIDKIEYNQKGRVIYRKLIWGDEFWYEYDENNKIIYRKFQNQYNEKEYWYEYLVNGNKIAKKEKRYERQYKRGKKVNEWIEFLSEYDSNGNKKHSKSSDGNEEWYEYDEKGSLIYHKYISLTEETENTEIFYEIEYDSNGNITTEVKFISVE